MQKKKGIKKIDVWGNGKAKREIMYVDDLASACEFFLKKKTKHSLINIGSGEEKTIENFAKYIMKKFNTKMKIKFDKKKPNGTPRKVVDTTLAQRYGWKSKFDLDQGFELTLKDFLKKTVKSKKK